MKSFLSKKMGIFLCLSMAITLLPAKAAKNQNNFKDSVLFDKLLACRSLNDDISRLHCFDENIKALDDANTHHDILVVDREAIVARQKQSFGFAPPVLALPKKENAYSHSIKKDQAADDVIHEITDKASFVSQDSEGHWIIGFSNGARWRQIDDQTVPNEPHVGSVVRLRKAALGSFVANIDKQSAIKMRRIQ
ncbi:hypothetical protein [Zymomonas mobilis]|uniref:hypothetical protein n=1 Tax=Zymomonas mobilis TaxID=542 RepID=UPI0003C769E4|nr:hypothetical protein [Zymomonas mobilis]AHB10899.1 hypothetical protein ZCP4_1628 [Zymomonas mobilis subsp. mobilis str. CP4 = NRRL B-14023]AHJ71211.1 hypothetical protein A254_01626 [Zymomonas mobilis subsp. mobilis NRRL B-12526]AHJ73065.1 hypothetical protein A265_01626 [Zymomonas mobilis subsp. mobilis str. CP4 = NRRL B-14023]TWE25447.1 hypothetical protein FBY52_1046 [Zymomonas mobilis]